MASIVRHGIAAAVAASVVQIAQAATFSWAEVKLTAASGVPHGALHTYRFKGIVKGYGTKKTTGTSFDVNVPPLTITSSTAHTVFATIWVQGKGRWDAAKNEATESLAFDGDVRGEFVSRLKCNADPWLAPASCAVIAAHYNGVKGPTYDWPGMVHKAKLPLSGKAVDAALAAQLSASATAAAPPPPPPPKPSGAADKPKLDVRNVARAMNAPTPQRAQPQPAPTLSHGTARAMAAVPPPALPDLASGAQLTVAGQHKIAWGGAIALTDADARAASGGVCQIAFEHELRNDGAAASGAFSRRWTNQAQGASLVAAAPSIAAGAALTRVDTLALRPGVNRLQLALDSLGQVKEADENNNLHALTVTLNGNCGGAPPAGARGAGVGGSRWSPANRQ